MSLRTEVKIADIIDLSLRALKKAGVSNADAQIIVDHLLDGELAGHSSHGFFRIAGIIRSVKQSDPPSEIAHEKQAANSLLLNGNNRPGLVVALYATNTAVSMAKRTGIAVVGGYNYAGTTGSMGYFTRKLADNDVLGFMTATSGEGVSPWGGIEMILGTNPISISIPSQADPIVADLATSKMSYGDLALAMMSGEKIPEGVVIDNKGNPSTDPHDADNGSQLPFGEHKGFALGLCFELLAGPFVKAKAGVNAVRGSHGFLILALKADLFNDVENMKNGTSRLIEEVKGATLRPGFTEILYPGERSQRKRIENMKVKHITIYTKILRDIEELA